MENTEKDPKLVRLAASLAVRAHRGQFRKDNVTPYACHAFRVSAALRDLFCVKDDKVLAAAMLHDTIEDTPVDFNEIEGLFGHDIAVWVALLSKDMRKPGKERELAYLQQLKSAPIQVKLIKLADAYDNVFDCVTAKLTCQIGRTLEKAKKYVELFKKDKDPALQKTITIVKELIARRVLEIKQKKVGKEKYGNLEK